MELMHPDWAADVRKALNDLIATYREDPDAYVAFDWDNTVAIFDVQDQAMIRQMEEMAFAEDPDTFAANLAIDLPAGAEELHRDICEAYRTLYGKYGPFPGTGYPGLRDTFVQDPVWQEFAASLLCMEEVMNGHTDNWKMRRIAGMTPSEVYDQAIDTDSFYSALPTHRVTYRGKREGSFVNGLTVTENLKELWRAFSENGIDVWVVSASPLDQIRAAVDFFGLHEQCRGVAAKTMKISPEGRLTSEYDFIDGYPYFAGPDGTWERAPFPTRASCRDEGKTDAIRNAIAPLYHGRGPIAGFMDSTGDFDFCTDFEDTDLVLCFNRGDRKPTCFGGLAACLALYERDTLGYDLGKARAAGDRLFLLQGRDENGMRRFRSSNASLRYGEEEERLLAGPENERLLSYLIRERMSVKDALRVFSRSTPPDAPGNPIGAAFGWKDRA